MSFPVSTLPGQIETGQIGLSELQRPFLWANTHVRDLFDSLYRSSPAGFFLLWQTTSDIGSVRSGADGKQTRAALRSLFWQRKIEGSTNNLRARICGQGQGRVTDE